MLRIDRIVHPTDFSPSAQSAMAYSLKLARLLGIRTDVLHVVPGMGPRHVTEFRGLERAETELDRSLAERFAPLREMAESFGADVRFLVGHGPMPGPVILDEVQREASSLIVLGAHGDGEAQADQLGSVSTDIVRRSTCPVLIVPPHVEEGSVDDDMQRIVTFVSYARLIDPVIVVASQLAQILGARLEVLAQIDGVDLTADPARWEAAEANLRGIVERHQHDGGETLPLDQIHFHAAGTADAAEILQFTREREADLLVLEAPGLASMDSPFEQAVEEIVGRAPCPVILLNTCGRAPGSGRPARGRAASRRGVPVSVGTDLVEAFDVRACTLGTDRAAHFVGALRESPGSQA